MGKASYLGMRRYRGGVVRDAAVFDGMPKSIDPEGAPSIVVGKATNISFLAVMHSAYQLSSGIDAPIAEKPMLWKIKFLHNPALYCQEANVHAREGADRAESEAEAQSWRMSRLKCVSACLQHVAASMKRLEAVMAATIALLRGVMANNVYVAPAAIN